MKPMTILAAFAFTILVQAANAAEKTDRAKAERAAPERARAEKTAPGKAKAEKAAPEKAKAEKADNKSGTDGIHHGGLGTGRGGGNEPGGANDRAIREQEAAERGQTSGSRDINPRDGRSVFEINKDAIERARQRGDVGASKK